MFARWIDRYVKNWAHADGVASWLVSACIEKDARLIEQLYQWTHASNRWKRRASAVALIQDAKRGATRRRFFELRTCSSRMRM